MLYFEEGSDDDDDEDKSIIERQIDKLPFKKLVISVDDMSIFKLLEPILKVYVRLF
jgi:hypothetical protein